MERDRRVRTSTTSSESPDTRQLVLGLVDEKDLWSSKDADPRARDELVNRYLSFAKSTAIRYRNGSEPLDDLFQVACLGLVNAVERFDPGRGVPFVGFASPTINGELKRYFRDRVSTVKLPRSLYDRIGVVEGAIAELNSRLSRTPDLTEISLETGMAQNEVADVLEASRKGRPLSLDAPGADDESEGVSLADQIGGDDERLRVADEKMMVDELVDGLPEGDRRILKLRFTDQLTQAEIAKQIDRSQMHVSRILQRILDRLRDRMPVNS